MASTQGQTAAQIALFKLFQIVHTDHIAGPPQHALVPQSNPTPFSPLGSHPCLDASPRRSLWKAKSRNESIEALGQSAHTKVEIQSAEIKTLVKNINSRTAVELAGVDSGVLASTDIGLPPEPENSISPLCSRPKGRVLDRHPGVEPTDFGPGDHYHEWHRKAMGKESVHPHLGLHSWGPNVEVLDEEPLSNQNSSECLSASYATAELIGACMASMRKDRLQEVISRPIGVGRAGREAAWMRHAAQTELVAGTVSDVTTYERLRMSQEDLGSARFGEICMEEARKYNLVRQEQLLTATYHAIKLQSRFRGWCARCRCAIKRREQKKMLQELRRAKTNIARREEFEEIAAREAEAEAARIRAPTAEMIRSQELAAIVDDNNFNEDHSDDGEFAERFSSTEHLSFTRIRTPRPKNKTKTRTSTAHSVVADDAVDKRVSLVEAPDAALAPLDDQPTPSQSRFSLDDLFAGVSVPSPVSAVRTKFEDCHQDENTSPYMLQARKAAQDIRFSRTRLKARSQAQARAKARANQRTATRMLNDVSSQQPRIQLTQSIKFGGVGEACETLRKLFASQLAERNEGVVKPEQDISEEVQDKYLECCGRYNAKPNSQVLEELRRSEPVPGEDGLVNYCFENAHVGDSGCVCLLQALALDPRLVSLSLRSCCLRGGSGPVLAVFIEMHPSLRDIDLSRNSLSYEFGELLLEALHQRSRLGPPKIKVGSARRKGSARGSIMGGVSGPVGLDTKKNELSVNLEGWFTGDVTDGYAVGPPCGNLWAGVSDNRSKLGPLGYEKLRHRLNNTDEVKFRSSDCRRSDITEKPSSFLDISGMSGGDKSRLRRGTARPANKPDLPDLQTQKPEPQKHKMAQQLVPIIITLPPPA